MIRAANGEDCTAVYDLICEMEQIKLDYNAFRKIFLEQAGNNSYICIVWEEDGHIFGCLNLRMEYQLHHTAKIAEIMELAVASDQRSKGIGKQLFETACNIAGECGCFQLEVCCNQLRKDAHRFYEREGMKKYHYKFTKKLGEDTPNTNSLGI